jgi:hypothetical protein
VSDWIENGYMKECWRGLVDCGEAQTRRLCIGMLWTEFARVIGESSGTPTQYAFNGRLHSPWEYQA